MTEYSEYAINYLNEKYQLDEYISEKSLQNLEKQINIECEKLKPNSEEKVEYAFSLDTDLNKKGNDLTLMLPFNFTNKHENGEARAYSNAPVVINNNINMNHEVKVVKVADCPLNIDLASRLSLGKTVLLEAQNKDTWAGLYKKVGNKSAYNFISDKYLQVKSSKSVLGVKISDEKLKKLKLGEWALIENPVHSVKNTAYKKELKTGVICMDAKASGGINLSKVVETNQVSKKQKQVKRKSL